MISPKIKFTEKKNSFNVKVKVSKEDVQDYLNSAEDVAELKKDFLNILSLEFDRFVVEMVEEENGEEMAIQVDELLQKVVVTQEEEEMSLDEEEKEEEQTA